MGLGTKNRQTQTAETCKGHLRAKHPDRLKLVEEFIAEFESAGANADITRWGQFTDLKGDEDGMLGRLDHHFERWLNPEPQPSEPPRTPVSGPVSTEPRPGTEPAVLALEGEIDWHNSHQVGRAFEALLNRTRPRIVVDLTKVCYIDSSGLAVLINAVQRTQSQGGDLALFGLSDNVRNIIQSARLDRIFGIFPDKQTASENC